jgi:hypothetical protein
MSTDEAQVSSTITADQNGYQSTLAADDAQQSQTDTSLQNGFSSQLAVLATTINNQIGGASPSINPTTALSSSSYQAGLASANSAWNTAQQKAQNDYSSGTAAADANATNLQNQAQSQLSTNLATIQTTYNTDITNADNQYSQAIAPFQQQVTNTLAADATAYNTAYQQAQTGYNSGVTTATQTQTASDATADSNYQSASQPLISNYNSWLSTRTTSYQSAINAREVQLQQALAGEVQTYNTTVGPLAQAEQTQLQAASTQYASDTAALAATRSSEDSAAATTCSNTTQGANAALGQAQQTYNNTVNQIMMQAQMNHQPPNQGALQAAMNALLSADHTFANTVAGAQAQLLATQGADLNEYVTNDKAKYKNYVDAVAAAEGAYETGVAAAAKLRDDNEAADYASRDADEAETTAGFNDDVATHYEGLQIALLPLQQAQTDAYDDAEAQYQKDVATAWQHAQGEVEDAAQAWQNNDAAAEENFALQIAGPWQTGQNEIAQAEQERAHQTGGADATYSTAMAAAVAADVSGTEAAYDKAMADIEAGIVNFANIIAPAWAAAIIAESGNDPAATAWANGWASYDEQEAADDAQLLANETGAQDTDISQGLSAYNGLVGEINTQGQTILDDWGGAVINLVAGIAGDAVAANALVMPQMLSSAQGEVNAARTEATKQINADVTAAQTIAGNDDADAKAHDAHAAGYGQTVLPAGLTDFTEVDDEAAGDEGTLAHDAAAYVKGMDGAAQTEIDDLVPDGAAMLDHEAVASANYVIATTANMVTANNNAATAIVAQIAAEPDSNFAGQSQGTQYVATGIYTPTDPGTVQPDKSLPQPPGILSSFFSDVSQFVQWITSPFLSPLPAPPNFSGGSLSSAGETLADLAVQALCPNLYTMSMLANAGYIPGAYMIGVQLDFGAVGELQGSADLAIRFTGGSPLDWEIGFIRAGGPGIRMLGGVSESIVLSAITNCNSLNELKGWAGTYDIGLSPFGGPWGGGVAVGNIGTDLGDSALWPFPYLAPGDNIPGRRPTVWSASTGPTFSPPQFVEPVTGGVVVTYTQVETITPREFLTAMTSWQNIQYAFKTWWQGGW